MTTRTELVQVLDDLLQAGRFKDYGPNGLQVEGRASVQRLVTGVTASRALIEAAIDADADTILVHHGLFWRGQDGRVVGWMKQRLALLLRHDINLLAYHLPLDAHPELGNNAQLAARLGWVTQGYFGEQNLGCIGVPIRPEPLDGPRLAAQLELELKRPVTLVNTAQTAIQKIAWCSGAAQSYFEAAVAAGADAFVTGEISEPQAHLARECGVAYLACGHHATERWGVAAVGEHLASQLGLHHQFIDIDNPA